jgi:hypothetical protein
MVAFVLRLNIVLRQSQPLQMAFGLVMRWLGIAVDRERPTWWPPRPTPCTADGRVILEWPRGHARPITRVENRLHIALGAGVPILMAYLDYAQKRGGLGPTLTPAATCNRTWKP